MTTNTAGQNRSGTHEAVKSGHGRLLGTLLLVGMGMPVLMAAPAATTTTLAVTANGLSVSSVDAGAV